MGVSLGQKRSGLNSGVDVLQGSTVSTMLDMNNFQKISIPLPWKVFWGLDPPIPLEIST